MTTIKFTGHEAIAYAVCFGLELQKAADPTEGARVVDVDEAREIVKEDPSLISIEAPAFDHSDMVATHAAVGNDGFRPVIWGLGTSAEMAIADALHQDGFDADDASFLRVEPVDGTVQERVEHGDVSWSTEDGDLGEAIILVRDLERQDAEELDAKHPHAVAAIAAWRAEARECDADLMEALDRLGDERAQNIYAEAAALRARRQARRAAFAAAG